jgi:hypothetical protein
MIVIINLLGIKGRIPRKLKISAHRYVYFVCFFVINKVGIGFRLIDVALKKSKIINYVLAS